ncbi:unnamed protein product [Discula destructiva]
MPLFRGIEVSILTQSLTGRLPEYPHPDGSGFQKPDNAGEVSEDGRSASLLPDNPDAVEHDPNASSRISVYVPSLPGSQFWIKYVVECAPSSSSHLFFKLYMNGRHITSWGINTRTKSKGHVEKALYAPCDRWDQEDNGVVFKPEGIEARYFYFVSDQQQPSIADDGGLIEVHVFRAKGRKRRAAKLDQYRQMDRYGVATPSGGLVDSPQEVTFFDFHLLDPKDAPFATFAFHYRSLTNLHQLNLIPTDDLSTLVSSPASTVKRVVDSISKGSFTILEDEPCCEARPDPLCQEPDEFVFNDSSSSFPQAGQMFCKTKPRRNSSYVLRTPPQLRPRSASSHNVPQPSKALRDTLPPGFPESYHSRPLPNLPLSNPPIDSPSDTCAPRSRKSSTSSAALSIAASLLGYVNNESYLDESIQFGHASEVPINKEHPGVPLNQEKTLSTFVSESARADTSNPVAVSDTSMSNYEVSLLTTDDSNEHDPTLLSPGNCVATTASTLEKHTLSSKDEQASSGGGSDSSGDIQNSRVKRADTRDLALDLARFPHLKLSESEWIRQTPSPQNAPRKILSPTLGRLWNTLRRNRSRSPLRNVRDGGTSRNLSTPQLEESEVKRRLGKWI